MLSEATRYHEESAERLEANIADATRIREEAVKEAERLKLSSVKEAEDRLAIAQSEATAISERTHAEFAWRKEQLRRETELLGQRKQAVLAQLASLSALAQETATAFPEPELADVDSEPSEDPVSIEDQVDPDATVLISAEEMAEATDSSTR